VDEGLNALNGKTPSATVWFRRSGKRDEIIKKFY
jgi:hypothetical protein